MGTGTSAALVSAVSNAGGLGILGTSHLSAEGIAVEAVAIRAQSDRPFGINFLLAFTDAERFAAGLRRGAVGACGDSKVLYSQGVWKLAALTWRGA